MPFDTERLYSRTPFVSSPTWVCSHSKALGVGWWEPKTSGITGSRVYPSGVREHTLGSYHASRSPRQRHSRFFLHLEPAPVPFDTERLYSRTPFVSSPTWVCSHSKASCPSMRPILAHRKERGRSPFDQRVGLWRERNACQRLQASVQVQPSCLDMSPTTFGD